MTPDNNELGLIEWAGGILVALCVGALGFLYKRINTVSDGVTHGLNQFRLELTDQLNEKHEENQRKALIMEEKFTAKVEVFRDEFTKRLEGVAAASASRQEQILFQLAGKASREDIRESEIRISATIAQRLFDLGVERRSGG